jgi:hypothetical protein
MKSRKSYFDAYENFAVSRSEGGVLTARFHTNDKELTLVRASTEDRYDQRPAGTA